MLNVLLQFIVTGTIIVGAGILLARSADAISRVTGLGQILVGALLVSTATSLPDLVVGISAARNGWIDLVVGDLIGAALINLLILAILDLSTVSRGCMLSRLGAAHALSGAMCITLISFTGLAFVMPDRINVSIAGISLGLWIVVVAYLLGLRLIYFDQRYAQRLASKAPEGHEDLKKLRKTGLKRPLAGYVIAAIIILFTGPRLAHSADELAAMTGLGNTFFGTAFLPLCTTLPELAVGITAIRMRAFPLVVGNAFGSIAFNLLLLAPIDIVYSGSLMADASKTHLVTCMAAIATVAVAIMGQLYHGERRKVLIEPIAMLIIMMVLAAFGLIYYHD